MADTTESEVEVDDTVTILVLDDEIKIDSILKRIRYENPRRSVQVFFEQTVKARKAKPEDAEDALRFIDKFSPDLVILGHNLGAGLQRAKMMPIGYIPITIVVRESFSLTAKRQYKQHGFKHFSDRAGIIKYLLRSKLFEIIARKMEEKLQRRLRAERLYRDLVATVQENAEQDMLT